MSQLALLLALIACHGAAVQGASFLGPAQTAPAKEGSEQPVGAMKMLLTGEEVKKQKMEQDEKRPPREHMKGAKMKTMSHDGTTVTEVLESRITDSRVMQTHGEVQTYPEKPKPPPSQPPSTEEVPKDEEEDAVDMDEEETPGPLERIKDKILETLPTEDDLRRGPAHTPRESDEEEEDQKEEQEAQVENESDDEDKEKENQPSSKLESIKEKIVEKLPSDDELRRGPAGMPTTSESEEKEDGEEELEEGPPHEWDEEEQEEQEAQDKNESDDEDEKKEDQSGTMESIKEKISENLPSDDELRRGPAGMPTTANSEEKDEEEELEDGPPHEWEDEEEEETEEQEAQDENESDNETEEKETQSGSQLESIKEKIVEKLPSDDDLRRGPAGMPKKKPKM